MSKFTIDTISNEVTDPDFQPAFQVQLTCSEGCDYQPGDWLTLHAKNPVTLVEQVIQKLALDPTQSIALRRIGEVSVKQALTEHLELTQLSPSILNKLQRQYPALLNGQTWSDRAAMQDWVFGKDILDLLDIFPDLVTLKLEFLMLLIPLAPRYYSIASSPLSSPKQICLLVRQVRYYARQRWHEGVASTYIAQSQPGDFLEGEVISNRNFKLPESPASDIIMVGAGVGLAPFMGFISHRVAQKATGENWLFFGERHPETSFLCREPLMAWQAQHQVRLITAFSRLEGQSHYIQDRLMAEAAEVWQKLQNGAYFYVCGSQAHLGRSIEQALLTIAQKEGEMCLEAAQDWLQSLRAQKQIQWDLY